MIPDTMKEVNMIEFRQEDQDVNQERSKRIQHPIDINIPGEVKVFYREDGLLVIKASRFQLRQIAVSLGELLEELKYVS